MVADKRKEVNGKTNVRFTKGNEGRFQATFNSLKVDKIKRPKSEKQVHEEKYRFVFVSEFEHNQLWVGYNMLKPSLCFFWQLILCFY